MIDEKIVKITSAYVYFKYRESNQEKVTKIKGEEFIRKFLMHVLPRSFMKIRHYGLFAGKGRKTRIKKLQVMTKTKKNKECQLKKLELLNKIVGKDVTKCPKCEGTLKLISKVYKNKPPNII